MRVLILGGTGGIGPHFVAAALANGHDVTVFNRGTNVSELPDEVETLIGDRNGDLSAIAGRDWDAVLDMATFGPLWVRTLGEALGDRVGHYTFISSINVYGLPAGETPTTEKAEVPEYRGSRDPYSREAAGPPSEPYEYGALKGLCEREAEAQFPGRTLILRPGYMTGPRDVHQALTYWTLRMEQGDGEVMAAGEPSQVVQFIDVRDVAEWGIRLVEQGSTNTYNVVGPENRLTLGGLLDACQGVDPSRVTWVSQPWLAAQDGAEMWLKLLFWSSDFGAFAGVMSNELALKDGLIIRPLQETLTDSLAWCRAQPDSFSIVSAAWPSYVEQEQKALEAWYSQ